MLNNPLHDAPRPIKFSVIRVPYLLEPDYDEELPFVESNRERLIKKWGGAEGWERQKRNHDLKGRGLEAGIPHFNLDRLASNTMASHRLIQHVSKKYGLTVSEGLYDRLNVYYFVEGHALNDKSKLAKVAAEEIQKLVLSDDAESSQTTMTEEEILQFLNCNEGKKEIQLALDTLREIGIHGIPKFIIEGRTIVDGACQSDKFVQIFRGIEKKGQIASGPVFGSILGLKDDIVQKGSHGA